MITMKVIHKITHTNYTMFHFCDPESNFFQLCKRIYAERIYSVIEQKLSNYKIDSHGDRIRHLYSYLQ